ncbi:MAG: LacI family DNA-binding transcriptional regulator [Candidatus Promineifilaceae bacterium]|nr:LacI family DNA-binding transcriptional regulator [Candidatus Promineifilaceae bacterium]
MATTIEEVAKKSGVSVATVSRALRGVRSVAPSTRDRVIKVAEELNYVVSPDVSRQAKGWRDIAVIRPLTDGWFYTTLINTIEFDLLDYNCNVVRYTAHSRETQTRTLQHIVSNRLADGIIVATLPLSAADIKILVEAALPVVTIETRTDYFSSVTIDNVAAGRLATQHLINLGHQQIGILTPAKETPLPLSTGAARVKGFRQAMRENGLELRPELEIVSNYTCEGGAEGMKQMFSRQNPPTAVFALSNEIAIGAIKTVRDLGLSPGKDISVIAFDDFEFTAYLDITTIRQPIERYGETAVELIKQQLDQDANALPQPKHITFEVELMLRSTTGPLPK